MQSIGLCVVGLLTFLAGLNLISGQTERPGICPEAPPGTMTPCIAKCDTDTNCPIPTQKCCNWGCMRTCLDPVIGKPGHCPEPQMFGHCALLCISDESCPGKQKCCSTGCGSGCRDPVLQV